MPARDRYGTVSAVGTASYKYGICRSAPQRATLSAVRTASYRRYVDPRQAVRGNPGLTPAGRLAAM